MKIKVSTHEAVEMLEKHLAAHQAEYTEQLAGWQEQMKIYGDELAAWAVNSGTGQRPVQPQKPEKYDNTYKRLIDMFRYHVDTTITLEDNDYDKVYRDKFHWKTAFHANTSLYTGRLLSADEDDDADI